MLRPHLSRTNFVSGEYNQTVILSPRRRISRPLILHGQNPRSDPYHVRPKRSTPLFFVNTRSTGECRGPYIPPKPSRPCRSLPDCAPESLRATVGCSCGPATRPTSTSVRRHQVRTGRIWAAADFGMRVPCPVQICGRLSFRSSAFARIRIRGRRQDCSTTFRSYLPNPVPYEPAY